MDLIAGFVLDRFTIYAIVPLISSRPAPNYIIVVVPCEDRSPAVLYTTSNK